MIIVASIFMFAGFYYIWQEKLAWDMNVPGAFGDPVQTVYEWQLWQLYAWIIL